MADVETLGLDPERLSRRIKFLEQRAEFHLKAANDGESLQSRTNDSESVIHLGFAGSLLRDAGASALLLGQYTAAKRLFHGAGRVWTRIGLFAGYLLLHVADDSPWWLERGEELDLVRVAINPESQGLNVFEAEGIRRAHVPLLLSSASSFPQLLHLYQSVHGSASNDYTAKAIEESLRGRLIKAHAVKIGATQTPLPAYVGLLNAVLYKDLGRSERDTLLSMVLRRKELLDVARADEYQWKMALAPAAIVDLDLLVFFLAAFKSGGDELLEQILGDRVSSVALPLEAARGLRGYGSVPPPRHDARMD